jgi:3',5'-cyclic AMP phosphodiesterase CpdA
MRFAQISDLHLTRLTLNPRHLCSKRLIGMANWVLNRKKSFHEERLTSLPALFNDLKVDLVLVGGDLTSTSLPSEFEAASKFFNKISQPKFFIPGNHDQYTEGSYRSKRFYRTFSNPRKTIEHQAEFFTLKEHGIEAHRLKGFGWCVLLDTAPPTSIAASNGLFSEELEGHLKEVLQLIGKERVILLNHFPFFQNDLPKHRLFRGDELRKILENHPNICLYLHGHTHRHSIADLQVNSLPIICDSGCPIQDSGSWNLIDLNEEGCTIQSWHSQDDTWASDPTLSFTWERK